MNKPLPIVLIGGGGHASVLADILIGQGREILAIICPDDISSKVVFAGIPHFTEDVDVERFNKTEVFLVNGIGSLPGSNLRFKVHMSFKRLGYTFMTVVSSNAIVSEFAVLAEGVQVMPGCIVNTNVTVGEATILNSGSIIEHDCKIGKHNHVAPGVVLSGSVITEDFVHIGTGAQVIQGIQIREHALVGAGATVTKNLESNKILYVAKPFLR
ncbi:acetyltransferase [Shewanella khirikhana]|uniref:Acetyltransferase EpsM n=1 Tax=Shewanella khirikhana TaxID=1965282 RepID=A0ABM7DNS4_9GAMM|nr:acetyltransferase [Shewanella khirikhana]AZQ11112.1 Putative acetyltransferase EpsM [Shewanella khirikhana]